MPGVVFIVLMTGATTVCTTSRCAAVKQPKFWTIAPPVSLSHRPMKGDTLAFPPGFQQPRFFTQLQHQKFADRSSGSARDASSASGSRVDAVPRRRPVREDAVAPGAQRREYACDHGARAGADGVAHVRDALSRLTSSRIKL